MSRKPAPRSVQLSVFVTVSTYDALIARAAAEGRPLSSMAERLLVAALRYGESAPGIPRAKSGAPKFRAPLCPACGADANRPPYAPHAADCALGAALRAQGDIG